MELSFSLGDAATRGPPRQVDGLGLLCTSASSNPTVRKLPVVGARRTGGVTAATTPTKTSSCVYIIVKIINICERLRIIPSPTFERNVGLDCLRVNASLPAVELEVKGKAGVLVGAHLHTLVGSWKMCPCCVLLPRPSGQLLVFHARCNPSLTMRCHGQGTKKTSGWTNKHCLTLAGSDDTQNP